MLKRLLGAIGLSLGLSLSVLAGPATPPAGKYILDVSTGINQPSFNVTSGTVRGPLYSNSVYVTGVPNGNCLQSGPGGQVTGVGFSCSAGGGGAQTSSTNTWTGGNTYVSSSTFTGVVSMSSVTISTLNISAQEVLEPGTGLGYRVSIPNYPFDLECSNSDTAIYCANITNTNAVSLNVGNTSNNPSISAANTFTGSPTSAGNWASAVYGTNSGQGTSGGVAGYFQTAGSTATLMTATTGTGVRVNSTSGNAIQIDSGLLRGQNFLFVNPNPSTATYGVVVGSLTVSPVNTINGNIQLTISGSTSSVISTTNTASGGVTIGDTLCFGSTNAVVVDCGAKGGGGGTPGGTPGSVQISSSGFAGSTNFAVIGSSVMINNGVTNVSAGSYQFGQGVLNVTEGGPTGNILSLGSTANGSEVEFPVGTPSKFNFGWKSACLQAASTADQLTDICTSANMFLNIGGNSGGRGVWQTLNASDLGGTNNSILLNAGEVNEVTVSTLQVKISTALVVTGAQTNTSSTTFGGSVTFSSDVVLNGSVGQSGQVFTTGVGGVPTWTTISGGGGSGSGTVNSATQFQVPYYSVAGSSNVLSGASNFTNTGSTITMGTLAQIVESSVTLQTASNVDFNYPGSTMAVTNLYVGNLGAIGSGAINGTNVQVGTLTVTTGATLPTYSHLFGKYALNQWFSKMGALQINPTAGGSNNLSIFILGDSHFGQSNIGNPFTDWMYSNFGNAGTYFPLSNYSEQNNQMRPNGCTYSIGNSTWTTNPQGANSLGLDDDSLHSSTPTATVLGTCPGADTVILHYTKQPNGGTINFSVDGANNMIINTANGSLAVGSATISGLTYGVHTASASYTTSGSAGVDVLDYVFYSTTTPGAVMYRVGLYGAQLSAFTGMNAGLYQNLLGMLPSPPSVVMLEFGVNESANNTAPTTMIANARTMMSRFRAVYPRVNCVYFSPPDYFNSGTKAYPFSAYEQAWNAASIQDGCGFVDFTALFSTQSYYAQYYNADGIHLNSSGGYAAAQQMINLFAGEPGNTTPFTYNLSSQTVTYGNDQSTNTLTNVTAFGTNILISSGISNAGAIGHGLTLANSNTFVIGGALGSGKEQNLIVSSITAGSIIDRQGIIVSTLSYSGSAPTVGTCGTTPSVNAKSTNYGGSITWSGAASTCGFTFAGGGFNSAPFCVAVTTGTPVGPAGVSASSATFSFNSGLVGSTMTWHCVSGNGG